MPDTLAIDPGLAGALAILGGELRTFELPTMGDGAHRVINGSQLYLTLVNERFSRAVVEAAQAMPKQGVSSVFKYGRAFGTIVGVLACLDVPIEYVSPAKWKADLKLSKDKDAARRRAIEVFPAAADQFALKKAHHRAEAALIAYWRSGR